MNPHSYADNEGDARDQASAAAAGTEHPTAAAEILILRFRLDPAADAGTPAGPVITVIALVLTHLVVLPLVVLPLVVLPLVVQPAPRRRRPGARSYSRSLMSSPS
jgi:hypothetical protein